jgi:PAS domain-containing protein
MTQPDPGQNRKSDGADESVAHNLPHDFGALLIESSPDALIAVASDHTVLFWNHGAEATFGYSKEQGVGRRFALQILVKKPVTRDRSVGL